MTEEERRRHFKAVRMLAATTIFWSLSFPLVKGITILQGELVPGSGSWFHASLTSTVRFGAAGIVVLLMTARTLPRITRSEIWQGLGLGVFAGGGILWQVDGLSYTSASTSAFVTQGFCVFVPLFVAIQHRRLPRPRVLCALALLLTGIAILSNFDLRTFRLGRGEAETLLAAVFFAAQILWLDRPSFAGNDPNHFSLVMFFTMALISVPILAGTWNSPRDVLICYSNPGVLMLVAAITFFCTVIAFVYMNRWQPHVTATEAAIIYGAEPVFASALALFLPAWISRATGIDYPNETLTAELLIGGALILTANLVLQLKWPPRGAGASNAAARPAGQ
jgi:drug/metabolite transporter (DMT)-like permease